MKQEIREAIRTLLQSSPTGHVVQHELFGFRFYRIRTCRVRCQLHDKDRTVDVLFVGPRGNVYEELRLLVEGPSQGN